MEDSVNQAPEGSVVEVAKPASRVIITNDVDDETMLRLDNEGYFLAFSTERGKFKVLSDEIFAKLSPMSRGAYSALKPIAEQEARVDPNFAPGVQVIGREVAGGASASMQIHGTKVAPGLVHYYGHPSKIAKREASGWRVARGKEIVHAVSPRLEGSTDDRRALKMGSGQIESVLMVKDAEQDRIDRLAKAKRREAMGEIVEQAAAEEAAKVTKDKGITPY